jgi:5-enolpyruvylshikimate-3-phosphate synthase
LFVFIDSGPDQAGFRRNVNVLSQTLPAGFTSDDYLSLTVSQMNKLGAAVDQSRDVTFAGLPGHEMTLHVNKAGKTLRFLEVWALRAHTAFLATYTSDSQAFEAPLADVRRLIASIRLPPSA